MDALSLDRLVGVVGVTAGVLLVAAGRDRFPRSERVLAGAGFVVLTAALGWLVVTTPWATLAVVAVFLAWNLAMSWAATTTRWNPIPADHRAEAVWQEEIGLVHSMGWDYLGSWVLDLGQVRPTFSSLRRRHDDTRIGMMGKAPTGGVVSIETRLDDGYGLLVTLRGRSSQLRPPWMFRQELRGSLEELIRAHDEALFLLGTRGISPAPRFLGSMLEFERFTTRKYRRDVRSRWFLYMLRPLILRLSASRRRPLHEQADLERQLERYGPAIAREADPSLQLPE
jgi:hypothetical protein